jgi:uncharacterized Zn-finger protein
MQQISIMKLTSLLVPALLITFVYCVLSCSKSNGGKPSISIESITTSVNQYNANMVVTLKFTSPGGKLSGGSFYSFRTRINQIPPPNPGGGSDTLDNPIPSFPNQNQGELVYTLPYNGYLSYGGPANDTLVFKFWAVDAAGDTSATITSPQVIIVNQ